MDQEDELYALHALRFVTECVFGLSTVLIVLLTDDWRPLVVLLLARVVVWRFFLRKLAAAIGAPEVSIPLFSHAKFTCVVVVFFTTELLIHFPPGSDEQTAIICLMIALGVFARYLVVQRVTSAFMLGHRGYQVYLRVMQFFRF
jgi:hypothetical protein